MPACYRACPMTSPAIITRSVTPEDADAIGALHARVFGPGRFARTAYRVREGTAFASPFCRLAEADEDEGAEAAGADERRDDRQADELHGDDAQPGEEYVATNTFILKAELGKEGAEHAHAH